MKNMIIDYYNTKLEIMLYLYKEGKGIDNAHLYLIPLYLI